MEYLDRFQQGRDVGHDIGMRTSARHRDTHGVARGARRDARPVASVAGRTGRAGTHGRRPAVGRMPAGRTAGHAPAQSRRDMSTAVGADRPRDRPTGAAKSGFDAAATGFMQNTGNRHRNRMTVRRIQVTVRRVSAAARTDSADTRIRTKSLIDKPSATSNGWHEACCRSRVVTGYACPFVRACVGRGLSLSGASQWVRQPSPQFCCSRSR